MSILRPRLKLNYRRTIAFALGAGPSEVDLFDLTGGPGIIKQGGFNISTFVDTLDKFSFIITVDGTDVLDAQIDLLDNTVVDAQNASWIFTVGATSFQFELDDNANWAFLSSVQFTLRSDTGAAETLNIIGGFDYHLGA